ncbi:LysR family transcriptional regulator [Fimbriiglobus ruber]|uniref:Transcriptional regulator, LysR family n=1 Tax=Fimbriiglobus ruber TaxID=1908690 RepID=A0A225E5M3_9BACT|nr:LysR family transcriptional regulator [Fimbriiglobus ruber]OWK43727.1 Transcriptional regulator, LysR family [Fimbriiglobus ruber]
MRQTQSADLGLLVALDALLAEGSVAGAARRLNLSAPAVSRALSRLRAAVGDPLLVRAGNRLVPTARAVSLRAPARALVQDALSLLKPEGDVGPEQLARTFTIRTSEGFVGRFGAALAGRIQAEMPTAVLRFVPEGDEDVEALRTGAVDLDIGVIGATGPEVVMLSLFEDEFVGVVRTDHPLTRGRITPTRFAEQAHISISRRGKARGPIDTALGQLGLTRKTTLVVPTPHAALTIVSQTDLVTALPRRLAEGVGARELHLFALPVKTPPVEISAAWHPRVGNDAAHKWLRELVRSACGKPRGSAGR